MRTLTYAVRLQPVLKYVGQLCFVSALLTLVPLAVSLWFGDYHISLRYGILAAGILALSAGLLRLPAPKQLHNNEAMVVSALIFLVVPLVMTWPLMASGLGFLDALFETISAVTTTGLSTTATVGGKPATFLFARAWMQWVGGLGIVVLSLAVMIQPGLVAKRLGAMEDYEEDMIASTRAHARRVISVYMVLTAAGSGSKTGAPHSRLTGHRDGKEDQFTVVTEPDGLLKGRRVVRGREKDCFEHYTAAGNQAGHNSNSPPQGT